MTRLDLDSHDSSGRPRRRSVLLTASLFVLVVGGAAAGAGFWAGRRGPPPGAPAAEAPVAEAPVAAPGTPPAAPAEAPAAAAPPGTAPRESETGPRRLSVTVNGPLEEAIVGALGPSQRAVAAELTQVANRLLAWSLSVSRDARSGDRLELLWGPAPAGGSGPTHSQEPVVEALRYDSRKLGKTFTGYRYQAPTARYARYYDASGRELEERLVDGPIREYEQVTSLVKDGRHHKGVDFRTPVGTPVHAPFDGVVERRNWNFAGNGNCLDLLDPATGRHAIFLHLDVIPKAMATGRAVKKGEQIAESGNSGHSMAPHLHYQLEDGAGKVLDPFKVHATTRAALAATERAAFDAARARFDAQLAR